MTFEINFTPTAANHVRAYRKFEQKIILDAVEDQVRHEPATETRNRKRLSENELSDWELRFELSGVLQRDRRGGPTPRQGQGCRAQGTQQALRRRPGGAAMKVIELGDARPTLDEVMGLAKDQLMVLREPNGTVYALSQVDDFDVEVELLKANPEFMAYLRQLSQERASISHQDLREELAL
jgi:hypothetical protein